MKFTDGYWHMRPGLAAHFAVQAHEVEVVDQAEDKALTVYAATKPLRGRGDTLNLRCSPCASPRRWRSHRVQMVHHKGRRSRGPEFELKPQPAPAVRISDDTGAATLTSGRLTVPRGERAGLAGRVPRWRPRRHIERVARHGDDGRAGRSLHGRAALARRRRVRLRSGRAIHALRKERPGRGSLERDGGTASEQAYKNIPST